MRPVKLTLLGALIALVLVFLSPATADCEPNCMGSGNGARPNVAQGATDRGDRFGRSSISNQPNVPEGTTDPGDRRSRLKFSNDWAVKATCLPDLQEWQRLGGHGAFAISQNGETCGYSFDHNSRSSARDRAMRQCSARGVNCRIVFEK